VSAPYLIGSGTYVDTVAVEAAVAGRPVRLGIRDREEVFRRMRAQGATREEIARRCNVSVRTVDRIKVRVRNAR
jgi:DNA-binding NarL/FixJ family response regulator